MIVSIGSSKALTFFYEKQSGLTVNSGEPMITYVAMGVNPLNEGVGPGWFDGSNTVWYKDFEYDYDLTVAKAKECLSNCLIIYRNEPVKTIKFFIRKTVSQWCDPLFQSIWIGPMESFGQQAKTHELQLLFRGEGLEPYFRQWMNGMLLLIYSTAFIFLLYHRKKEHGLEYAYLFFLGGFMFHLVWEAKSQYIYPYVFVLIPCSAWMMNQMLERVSKNRLNLGMTEAKSAHSENIDISA